MARLPQAVHQLCSIEKLKIKTYTGDKKTSSIEVVAKDGREFIIFEKDQHAVKHAVDIFIKYDDDPERLKQLGWLGKTLEQYATDQIEENSVQSVISYDQHHKVQLPKGAVAYRIM